MSIVSAPMNMQANQVSMTKPTESNKPATVNNSESSSELMQKHGRFISFEGTEGVGKTTAINQLCARLETSGIHYVRTREPGGSPFAERLRDILLDPATAIGDDTELLLLFAARCDHLQRVILPALQNGSWVICDRFTDSTIAYQGFGRAHGDTSVLKKVDTLIDQFVPVLPELTLWLDLPVLEGMARAGKRSVADRFEQQAAAFFARVYAGFETLANEDPKRIQRINASGSSNEVSGRIWQVIESKFGAFKA